MAIGAVEERAHSGATGGVEAGAPAAPGTPATRWTRRTGVGMLVIFAVSLFVYWVSPVRMQTDSFWVASTARSLVRDGDVRLDEHDALIRLNHGFQIDRIDGHSYYSVPLGTSLTAVPVIAVASLLDADHLDAELGHGRSQPWDGVTAALLAAASAAVIFAIARRRSPRLWVAYATAGTFAFGTQMWGIASRTVWMQTPSILCLSLALLFALKAKESARWIAALGAVLALGYFVRPTNAVAVLAFGVWVLVAFRDDRATALRRYVVGAGVVTALFVAVDVALYGHVMQPYFRASRLEFTPTVVGALLANLVSPSRGIFVFVPVTILCVLGFRSLAKSRALSALDITVGAIIVGNWLAVSCFPHWWGGWSYGPRFLADVLPCFVWFLPPLFDSLARSRNTLRIGLVVFVVVVGVGIQARGAFVQRTATWNWEPRYVDPARVWDWSDPQFLA